MIIYNVTLTVDADIAEEWLQWMRTQHIPEVMKTGMFDSWRILRVLTGEQDGMSYAVQYECRDMSTYERYRSEFAPALQAQTLSRYGNKVLAFRTLLEVLE